jgi:small subunit ribosomal protein S16
MLRIRLRRVGKKNQPSYRIVVADSRAPRDGVYIDQVGFYNPLTDPPTIRLDTEKASKWLANGAQPSEPVQRMLRKVGLLEEVGTNAGVD